MILAAGLGTRLKPITDSIPKALVPVRGRPLLEWIILKLGRTGFNEIIINVHHHREKIKDFLDEKSNFGLKLSLSEENDLLDTGGGIKKASWFFDNTEPFLVHNVDVLSDIDLNAMLEYHRKTDALVTLAVRKRKTSRYLIFNDDQQLCGWKSLSTGETRLIKESKTLQPRSFMGIHIASPQLIPLLDEADSFSIIQTYLRLVAENHVIKGFTADNANWLDLGRKENLMQVSATFHDAYFNRLIS